jgi:hypothetical protein
MNVHLKHTIVKRVPQHVPIRAAVLHALVIPATQVQELPVRISTSVLVQPITVTQQPHAPIRFHLSLVHVMLGTPEPVSAALISMNVV